jgi:hypothetical protein
LPRFLVDDLAAQVAGKAPCALEFSDPQGGVQGVGHFLRRHFDRAAR